MLRQPDRNDAIYSIHMRRSTCCLQVQCQVLQGFAIGRLHELFSEAEAILLLRMALSPLMIYALYGSYFIGHHGFIDGVPNITNISKMGIDPNYIIKIKIHSSGEIEDFVETHLRKLCVIYPAHS